MCRCLCDFTYILFMAERDCSGALKNRRGLKQAHWPNITHKWMSRDQNCVAAHTVYLSTCGCQGEAAIRRSMPRERGQTCARMTCRPDEPPAVNPEAPSSSTSSFPIEPTPAPTCQLHAGDHTQRRASSGGNYRHISAINCHDANIKTEPEEAVNHTEHTDFL